MREKALDFIVPFATVLVGIGTIFCTMFFVRAFQRDLCPGDTLMYRGTPDANAVSSLPVFFVIMAGIYGRRVMKRLAAANAAAAAAHVLTFEPAFKWIGVAMIVGWGLLQFNAAFSYYCVTPENIAYRANYFSRPTVYEWSAIDTVRAQCWHKTGRYGSDADELMLVAADGQKFEIGLDQIANAVQFVTNAIGTRPYRYDVSLIQDTCPANMRAALLAPALARLPPSAGR